MPNKHETVDLRRSTNRKKQHKREQNVQEVAERTVNISSSLRARPGLTWALKIIIIIIIRCDGGK